MFIAIELIVKSLLFKSVSISTLKALIFGKLPLGMYDSFLVKEKSYIFSLKSIL